MDDYASIKETLYPMPSPRNAARLTEAIEGLRRARWNASFKYIPEGRYVAEVEVELQDSPDEWAPHLSLEDAYRLDDVRAGMKR